MVEGQPGEPVDAAPEGAGARAPGPLPPGPTGEGERLPWLDVLRGVAVLGIVPANVPSFALPAAADGLPFFVSPAPGEAVALGVLHTLVRFKFMSLFALLFGVGIALQRRRALLARRPFFAPYAWRLALLAGIGLGHVLLLWYGDILFWYALVGVGGALLAGLRPRLQLGLAAGALLVPVVLAAGLGALAGAVPGSESWEGVAPRHRTLEAALADPGAERAAPWEMHPGREARITASGSFGELLVQRLSCWGIMIAAFVVYYGWRVLGLFLLGMAAFHLGWISRPLEHRRALALVAAAGLALGLPGELGLTLSELGAGSGGLAARGLREGIHQLTSLAAALGYGAAVLLLVAARGAGGPLRPLEAVGRTALSCYLLTSLLAAALCYSWGLGLHGRFTRVELWGVSVAIWAVLLAGSSLWLRWFRQGPVEWAWRSLAYGALQPLRRRAGG